MMGFLETVFPQPVRPFSDSVILLPSSSLMAVFAGAFYPDDPFRLAGTPLSVSRHERVPAWQRLTGTRRGVRHRAWGQDFDPVHRPGRDPRRGFHRRHLRGPCRDTTAGKIDDAADAGDGGMFQTIPSFVFAILLVAIMKPSIESIVIAITVVSWPGVARLVRGEFLSLKNREFVQACHTLGMGDIQHHAAGDPAELSSVRSSSSAR